MTLNITMYSRNGCHLCEQAEDDLRALQDQYPHKLAILDLDENPELEATYGFEIPVIEVGPFTLKAPFDQKTLAVTLAAAQDRLKYYASTDDAAYKKRRARGSQISKADRFAAWFSKRYMLLFNLFIFIYVGLPVLAPVLLNAGAEAPAKAIYRLYGGLCHQLSYRSIFLFGDQWVYPRAAAGLDQYTTFHNATGLDELGLLEARAYQGEDGVGFKMALCQRDMAIYAVMLIFGLAFSLTGRRWKPLPLWAWLLFGLVPIGLDGGTQLVSMVLNSMQGSFWQTLAAAFPLRESTPFLRILTGGLFGLTTAWFGYPLVEESMVETRILLTKKFAHLAEK
ncbi:MAG: DUF2085 domain-containing protein [Anaerolineales bacterium]|nr:DUF2085 domain-containing protein [Anaerolineales bacterium]